MGDLWWTLASQWMTLIKPMTFSVCEERASHYALMPQWNIVLPTAPSLSYDTLIHTQLLIRKHITLSVVSACYLLPCTLCLLTLTIYFNMGILILISKYSVRICQNWEGNLERRLRSPLGDFPTNVIKIKQSEAEAICCQTDKGRSQCANPAAECLSA